MRLLGSRRHGSCRCRGPLGTLSVQFPRRVRQEVRRETWCQHSMDSEDHELRLLLQEGQAGGCGGPRGGCLHYPQPPYPHRPVGTGKVEVTLVISFPRHLLGRHGSGGLLSLCPPHTEGPSSLHFALSSPCRWLGCTIKLRCNLRQNGAGLATQLRQSRKMVSCHHFVWLPVQCVQSHPPSLSSGSLF